LATFAGATAILAKIGVAIDSTWRLPSARLCAGLYWAIAIALGKHTGLRRSPPALGFLALSGIATGLSWLCSFGVALGLRRQWPQSIS